MNMSINVTNWIIAFLPLFFLLVMMLGRRWGAAEAGCRCRLDQSRHLGEGAPLFHVGMLGCFGHRQDGGETDVGALHQLAPLSAGLLPEHLAEALLESWPMCLVVLVRKVLTIEPDQAK